MPKKDRSQDEGEEIEELQEQPANIDVEATVEEGLVKMRKGDDVLHVHPTTVKAHQSAGWTHA